MNLQTDANGESKSKSQKQSASAKAFHAERNSRANAALENPNRSNARAERGNIRKIMRSMTVIRDAKRELDNLVLRELKLIQRIEQHEDRIEAMETHGPVGPPIEKFGVVLGYLAELQNGLDLIGPALQKIKHHLSHIPRLQPVALPGEEEDGTIRSVLDGTHSAVLQWRLRQYGITKADYRRLFALPDSSPTHAERITETRRRVMIDNKVWEQANPGKRSVRPPPGKRRARASNGS